MKVLWLVSITIPAAADACGLQAKEIGGGWLSGALGGMTAAPDAPAITVASVDARAETLTVCSKNGVSFALVPTGSVENFSALLKKIAPDLVHIWGTEYAAARTIQQAAQAAGIPVLVGIQGVMVDCALHLNDGVPARLLHSCAAQHLIDRHVPGGLLDVNQARFDTLAQSEAAVLANARHVTGRTSFDRSAVQKLAPQASYYPCNETLRPEFYTPPVWHPRTFGEAPVLLLSQGNYPLKNLHTVLKALPAVLAQYPGAVLRVAGWPPLDKGPLLRPVIDWMFPYQTWRTMCSTPARWMPPPCGRLTWMPISSCCRLTARTAPTVWAKPCCWACPAWPVRQAASRICCKAACRGCCTVPPGMMPP